MLYLKAPISYLSDRKLQKMLSRNFGLALLGFIVSILIVPIHGAHPCNLRKERWVQGVFPRGGFLYLLLNDDLYSIPFDASHIDSAGRRIKLFGARYTKHQNWRQVDWLMPLPMAAEGRKLIQLNVLPTERSDAQWAFVVLGKNDSANSFMNQRLVKLSKDRDKGLYLGHYTEKYSILGDGAMGGYILRIGTGDVITGETTLSTKPYLKELVQASGTHLTFLPRVPLMLKTLEPDVLSVVKPMDGVSTYKIKWKPHKMSITLEVDPTASSWADATGEIFFEDKPSKHYGFVHGGVVHYWNFFDDRVYLFQDPAGSKEAKQLYTVPMGEYFACSEVMWNTKDGQTTPAKNGQFDSSHLIMAAAFLGGIFLFIGLIAIYCCWCRRRARKLGLSSSTTTTTTSVTEKTNNRGGRKPEAPPMRRRGPSGASRRGPFRSRGRGRKSSSPGLTGSRRKGRSPSGGTHQGTSTLGGINGADPNSPTTFLFPDGTMNALNVAVPVSGATATSAFKHK